MAGNAHERPPRSSQRTLAGPPRLSLPSLLMHLAASLSGVLPGCAFPLPAETPEVPAINEQGDASDNAGGSGDGDSGGPNGNGGDTPEDPPEDGGDTPGDPPEDGVTCTVNPYARVDWATWGQYKANFHTHTTESDGREDPSEVIGHYHSAGYSILAITDHGNITWPWSDYGRDPEALDMIAVRGDEYSGSHHVNAFYDFEDGATDLESGIPHIQASGGLCQINHPGRYSSPSDWEWYVQWYRDYPACVGLEVINRDDSHPTDRRLWDNINEDLFASEGRFVWGTANDDMHGTADLYHGFQFMLMPELTEQELKTSQTSGAFYFCSEPEASGDARVPRISELVVDNTLKTITIAATNYDTITWIGPGTSEVGSGAVFDFSDYRDKPFVRAVLVKEDSGDCYTQPFGMETR